MKTKLIAVLAILLILFSTVQPSQARGFGPGLIIGSIFGAALTSAVVYSAVNPAPTYYYTAPYYYPQTVVYAPPSTVVYQPAPTSYPAPAPAPAAPATQTQTRVPYGYVAAGQIKSPFSSFTMSLSGHSSGDVVYDANTGSPFKIP